MAREMTPDTIKALDGWARHHAALFVEDRHTGEMVERTKFTKSAKEGETVTVEHFSRDWIMLQFFNFTFRDEFDHIVSAFRQRLGAADLADFNARLAQLPPRSEAMFIRLLEEKRPAGYKPKEA